MASVNPRLDELLATLPAVRRGLRAVARDVQRLAHQRALQHHLTGDLDESFRIVDRDEDVLVVSMDWKANIKEYGHTDDDTGKHVEGLFIMTGAAADVASRRR